MIDTPQSSGAEPAGAPAEPPQEHHLAPVEPAARGDVRLTEGERIGDDLDRGDSHPMSEYVF